MRLFRISVALLISAASVVFADHAGLKIDVTEKVECDRKTKSGDHILVHYRGTLTNGKEFDASRNRGSPFEFTVGAGQVIKGWDQGLLDMCIGEKRTLTVPPSLGYGSRNAGPIPPDSTLKLMGIKGVENPSPKPESTASESVSSESSSDVISSAAEKATEGIKEKILNKVTEAAEAVKVTVQDTDGDGQEHNEL